MDLFHPTSMGAGKGRAVTPVLGFVLLLGILVMAVTMWQTQILPQDNSDHEFRHYQDLTDDLTNLQNTILAAATGGIPNERILILAQGIPREWY